MDETGQIHRPVLKDELVECLDLEQSNTVIDATIGFGGHASGVLNALGTDGHLIGVERDPSIHTRVKETFSDEPRVEIVNENYRHLERIVSSCRLNTVDAIYFDLGMNSYHVDSSSRGFSFHQKNSDLDMRYNPDESIPSAAEWLNTTERDELLETFRTFGEVRSAVSIVDEICSRRPMNKVSELTGAVDEVVPPPYRNSEYARVFQALRIQVNQELKHLRDGLKKALEVLSPEGRMAVISFHSLEDRTVKEFFRHESKDCVCPPELPKCACDKEQTLEVDHRSPLTPGKEEIEANNRSRSAQLRIAKKL